MTATPEIKGWCPSAHAPMASGDGLLIRAHTFGSRVSATQLRAIAAISADCGNGLVDLTQRARLQLRGLSEATIEEARERLDEHGLVDRNAHANDAMQIIAGPRACGLHTGFDLDALLLDLERQRSEHDSILHALPAKFLVSIDTGGKYTLADAAADIRIEAIDKSRVAVCVAGAPGQGAIVNAPDVATIAISLARAFVTLRGGRFKLRRMRHLVAAHGLGALLREAKIEMQPYCWREPTTLRSILGMHTTGDVIGVGVGAPFGRLRARELASVADLVAGCSDGVVHLTHWRALLLSAPTFVAAQRICNAARALDLIVAPDDPRLSVIACPGAPDCAQAQGETRRRAARLAPLAQQIASADGVGLHVSGCAKGCARQRAAPITLVARNGHFDLVENGAATDMPSFVGLTIEEIERALVARIEEALCHAQ